MSREAGQATAHMVGYHGGQIVRRDRPTLLQGAIWQQFARETADIIQCA